MSNHRILYYKSFCTGKSRPAIHRNQCPSEMKTIHIRNGGLRLLQTGVSFLGCIVRRTYSQGGLCFLLHRTNFPGVGYPTPSPNYLFQKSVTAECEDQSLSKWLDLVTGMDKYSTTKHTRYCVLGRVRPVVANPYSWIELSTA